MASKMQNRNLLKEKDAKRGMKLYQDELPDEIALRDEILQLKKQIISLRKANERNLVKVRKYEDEAKRKDRQIEQLMDPIKNGDVRKLLSTKGAMLLLNLKEQNNTLVQMILDKDLQIKRLLAEIKTSKLYAKRIKPESYKIEIDRLRNLLIKSQNVLKEAQEASERKAICVGGFTTSEMHLSSEESSPRDLEELQETIRSLEKHMKYSNDLIAKKNEQIMQLMDHLNAAMNMNACSACKENFMPRHKLDSDVGLRNLFDKNSCQHDKDIYQHDEVNMNDDTRFKIPYSYGQTRFHSAPAEYLDKIFSFNVKKTERLTNSATERQFKNNSCRGDEGFSNSKEGLNKAYCTEEYFLKNSNASKNEEFGIQITGFDVSNTIENVNKNESQTDTAFNMTNNFDNRGKNWSDIQKTKKASFDEFNSIKDMENCEKPYPITISVFDTQDIILTHKTPNSSEDAKSLNRDTPDDFDMETDEFEAMENKIKNEIEPGSLSKIQADEDELKWVESNAESQIIKLNESAAETKKAVNSANNCLKTIQHCEHFEPTNNLCFPEINNGKRFEEQYHEETKAVEEDHSKCVFDDHALEASEHTLKNSDFSNDRESQSENEIETSTSTPECFNNDDQKEEKDFYDRKKCRNEIRESIKETKKANEQLIPEKSESSNDFQKSFMYNQKMVSQLEIEETRWQTDNSSLHTENCRPMAQDITFKIKDEIKSFNPKFNENLESEGLSDNQHNGTNNTLISPEICRDEDDDDVVVGLIY